MGSSLKHSKRWLIFLVISIQVFLSNCEKDRNRIYKVSGVLYDKDGITPVPNHKLSIALINFSGLGAWAKGDYLAYPTEGYTNENGAFELEYQHDKKALHMQVFSESAGMLITTAANSDHDRDLCLESIGYLKISFYGVETLKENDTLFLRVGASMAITKNKETIDVFPSRPTVNVITYPFFELSLFNKLKVDWNRESISTPIIEWQINKFTGAKLANTYGNALIDGFPHINEITIDVSK